MSRPLGEGQGERTCCYHPNLPLACRGVCEWNGRLTSAHCCRAQTEGKRQGQEPGDKGCNRRLSVTLRAGGWSWCPGVGPSPPPGPDPSFLQLEASVLAIKALNGNCRCAGVESASDLHLS